MAILNGKTLGHILWIGATAYYFDADICDESVLDVRYTHVRCISSHSRSKYNNITFG